MGETFEGLVQITTPGGGFAVRTIDLNGREGSIGLYHDAKRAIFLNPKHEEGKYSALFLGEGKAGVMVVRDSVGKDAMILNGGNNSMALRDTAERNSIIIDGANSSLYMHHYAGNSSITLDGANPKIVMRNNAGQDCIKMYGHNGDIELYDKGGKHSFSLHGLIDNYTGLWLGASSSEMGGNKPGKMFLRDSNGINSITLDGSSGDIILSNADCAEDFEISNSKEIEPGTVMVIEQEGKLKECDLPYDKRVAGIISGAGDYKPGLVLDKRKSIKNRKSISLMGKVFCKVDAQSAPIDVGDLLTTSSTLGYAMKAADPVKAFGSVIGKALRPLKGGKGLIPVLVALQ